LTIKSRQPGIPADALLLQTWIFRKPQGKYIGSGAFAVASKFDDEIRLTRRVSRPGRITDVRLTAYPTPRHAFAPTMKGDAYLIFDLESKWLEFFRGVPSLQVVRGAGRSVEGMMLNPDLPRNDRRDLAMVLSSPRMRELAYAPGECAETAAENIETTLASGRSLRILSWGPYERLALAARRMLADRGGDLSQVTPHEAMSRVSARDFDLVTAR